MVTIQKSGEVGQTWPAMVAPFDSASDGTCRARPGQRTNGKSRQAQSHNELKEFSHHVFPFWKSTSRRGLEVCLRAASRRNSEKNDLPVSNPVRSSWTRRR